MFSLRGLFHLSPMEGGGPNPGLRKHRPASATRTRHPASVPWSSRKRLDQALYTRPCEGSREADVVPGEMSRHPWFRRCQAAEGTPFFYHCHEICLRGGNSFIYFLSPPEDVFCLLLETETGRKGKRKRRM